MATVARVLLGLLLVLVASRATQSQAADEGLRASVLRVDTAQAPWRDAYVSVSDSQGLPVTGLDRNAFNLVEDGASVPIDRAAVATDSQVPIAVAIVMDVSGSMNDDGKLDAAKQAANQVVASLGPADNAAIIRFAEQAEVVQGMTADKDALSAAIDNLHAGGNTALYDAVLQTTLLTRALPQPFRVQLIVTDGADTSSTAHLSDVLQAIRAGRTLVYAVGIGSDVDGPVLDQITQAGNAQTLYAADPSEVGPDFQSVLDRLRLAYVLHYHAPAAPASGETHSLAANITYQGQVAQANSSFMTATDAVTVDVGGVTPSETVTGDRQVRATLRSGNAQRMDLLVDGTTAASTGGQPSSIVGELTRLPPGDHDLAVRVADSLGNVTVQHVPFTVASPPTAVPVSTPEPTVQPIAADQQNSAVEPSFWWLWAFVVLMLVAGALYLAWLAARTPASTTAVAAAGDDDTTLDLAAPADGVAAAEQDLPRLRVEAQGQQQEFALGSVPVSIGRDADNSIVLHDLHVSRHHARISLDEGVYWIEDLKSQNGTLLHGQVAIDRRQLDPGDQFAIGSATLTYLGPVATASAPTGSDTAAPQPVAV